MQIQFTEFLHVIRMRALKTCVNAKSKLTPSHKYYCMFCRVTHIVGSNLKSKNQEVSGFSDQWVRNAMVDFNEI